jgi:hypothetical protein
LADPDRRLHPQNIAEVSRVGTYHDMDHLISDVLYYSHIFISPTRADPHGLGSLTVSTFFLTLIVNF